MKCLLFIITLCSIGRFIDVQGENDADSNLSSNDPGSYEIAEDNRSEQSEKNTYDKYYGEGDALEAKSSGQKRRDKIKETLPGSATGANSEADVKQKQKQHADTMSRFLIELDAGDNADLMGQNQHMVQSHAYIDLGRRSEAQALKNIAAENIDYLTPEKAPPELVLLVAKESALLRAGKDTDLGSDFDRKKLLRSGDYWNGVWKEEVKPKSAMRSSSQKKKLGSIKAKINPGTEFYKVVSRMKKISPQLLYIINKKQP